MVVCIRKIYIAFFIILVTVILLTGGCQKAATKGQIDQEVYEIIDAKWDDEFGSRANYKISDTEPLEQDIQSAGQITSFGVLTLPQAVALATANNRDYQTQRETLYKSALNLRLIRGDYEMTLFGGSEMKYSEDPKNAAFTYEANGGFNKLLKNGALISANLAANFVDVLAGNSNAGFGAILESSLTVPLLRGADPKVVLEKLTQAERNTLYQIRTFNRYRKEFVVAVVSEYYEVLKLYDITINALKNYEHTARLLQQAENLAQAGLVPLIEVERIKQEVLVAEDVYVQAQREYEDALDNLKITLSLSTNTKLSLDFRILSAIKIDKTSLSELSEEQVIEAALYQRLEMANSADAILDAQRKVYVAADALGGQLDVVVDTELDSHGDNNIDADLKLDLPLDRRKEEYNYRLALINLNQRRREYDLLTDTITLQVRQAHRKFKESAQRYRIQTEALQLAQERFNKSIALLQYGRTSSRRVLDALQNMYDAQNALIQAKIDYTISTLEFYRDTGVLRVMPDGMWQL